MRALSTERMLNINNAHYIDYVLGYSKMVEDINSGSRTDEGISIIVFFANKNYSRSFVKLPLNP